MNTDEQLAVGSGQLAVDPYTAAQDAAIRLNEEQRVRFREWFAEWDRMATPAPAEKPFIGPKGQPKMIVAGVDVDVRPEPAPVEVDSSVSIGAPSVAKADVPSAGLIYLASPYSHSDRSVVEGRFHAVCRAAARLIGQGHLIFSPIAHTHPIAMAGELPTGWDFWQRYDHAQLDAAAELWVLRLAGWDQSVGIREEIRHMDAVGKPVRFIDPEAGDLQIGIDPAGPVELDTMNFTGEPPMAR